MNVRTLVTGGAGYLKGRQVLSLECQKILPALSCRWSRGAPTSLFMLAVLFTRCCRSITVMSQSAGYGVATGLAASGNQILRIAVIGLDFTMRLSHSRGKIPLEGYGTIARRFYVFRSIWRARCGNWPYRMSRSLTGRIGRRSPRVRRRFTEQGGFFQFILDGSASVQL